MEKLHFWIKEGHRMNILTLHYTIKVHVILWIERSIVSHHGLVESWGGEGFAVRPKKKNILKGSSQHQ